MKHKLSTSLGLIVLLTIALAVSPAKAQTVAAGPYYANPSWDQKLDCTATANCPRFIVLSNWASAAVLDRETGLVWEKSPSATRETWLIAQRECNQKAVGNRLGWRLPTVQELASLIDPSLAVFPPLPSSPIPLPNGHPFANIQKFFYWSANIAIVDPPSPDSAWVVGLDDGRPVSAGKTGTGNFWCVRGGQGVDPQ